jgi:hypothetical protein
MRRTRYSGFLIFILIILPCCQKQIPDWPKNIFESLWVPQGAEQIKYYFIKGSYQIGYEAKICYPGDDFINALVNEMKKRNWRRLEFDFLNPGLKLNHARGAGGTWSRFVDHNGKDDVYQWIEDWEDSQKNIVRYGFKYHIHKGGAVAQDKCSLKVNAIYIPAEILSER